MDYERISLLKMGQPCSNRHREANMKPIVPPANDVSSDAGMVFAVHGSALAFLTGELSAFCLQRDQAREEALFRFGRGWLRKNWKSHVAPVLQAANRLRSMHRRERLESERLFVAFAEEYDPDSSSAFIRAMRLDDARKFAMVRKVMALKPYLDARIEREVAAWRAALGFEPGQGAMVAFHGPPWEADYLAMFGPC